MIKQFIKGILIGVAKTVPGVSGSVLAISLGIYSKSINILNRFYKMTKEDLKYIFPIFIGVIVGILCFSMVIESVYKKNYLLTMLLFTGFIIGDIHKEVSVNLKKDILFYIIIIGAFLILTFFNIPVLRFNNQYLLFGSLGLIEAFTMIIPGISGTAILMSFNLYDVYLDFIISLTSLDYWLTNIGIILIYTLSMIISGYLTIKLVALLYSKFKYFNSVVRVLMVMAIIVMLQKAFLTINGYDDIIFGLIVVILGIFLSCFFNKMLSKKNGCI